MDRGGKAPFSIQLALAAPQQYCFGTVEIDECLKLGGLAKNRFVLESNKPRHRPVTPLPLNRPRI